MKKQSKIIWCTRIFLLILGGVSAYMLVSYYGNSNREEQAFQKLSQQLNQAEDGIAEELQTVPNASAGLTQSGKLEQKQVLEAYAALYKQNPDFFGWLRIEGTPIDYPVMHTPEDPEYYLHRAFDKTDSTSGVPFLDGNWQEGCGNYIIYGHNMKSKTMFSALLSYAQQAYWEQHPAITFDTLWQQGEYEVLAAFYAKIYPESTEEGFRYYQYTNLTDEAVFEEYLAQVQAAALYDTGVKATYGDTLLTLTTCSYHTENGRFVVVARQKDRS